MQFLQRKLLLLSIYFGSVLLVAVQFGMHALHDAKALRDSLVLHDRLTNLSLAIALDEDRRLAQAHPMHGRRSPANGSAYAQRAHHSRHVHHADSTVHAEHDVDHGDAQAETADRDEHAVHLVHRIVATIGQMYAQHDAQQRQAELAGELRALGHRNRRLLMHNLRLQLNHQRMQLLVQMLMLLLLALSAVCVHTAVMRLKRSAGLIGLGLVLLIYMVMVVAGGWQPRTGRPAVMVGLLVQVACAISLFCSMGRWTNLPDERLEHVGPTATGGGGGGSGRWAKHQSAQLGQVPFFPAEAKEKHGELFSPSDEPSARKEKGIYSI